MTFVLIGLRRSGNFSLRSVLIKIVRSFALQALFPLRRGLRPARELLRTFRSLGLPPLLLPALQEGRIRGGAGGSRGAPGVASREASSPPARPRSSERGGSVSGRSSAVRKRASVSSAPSGAVEGEVARSQWMPPARAASSVASPHSSQHALRRGESGESSVVRSRWRSSRVFQSSDRGTRKDRRAHSRSDSSRDRSRRSRSRCAYRSWSSGRERRRRESSRSLSSRERLRHDQSRSSDRSRSHCVRSRSRGDRSRSSERYRSRRDWSRSSDCYRSRLQHSRSPARRGGRHDRSRSCDPPRRSRDHSRSRVRSLSSSDRSRSKEGGRRARHERQEGVEMVAVSQAPVVSEVSAAVAPPVGLLGVLL